MAGQLEETTVSSLREIDYPPHWPNRHVLQVTGTTCQFIEDEPGRVEIFLGNEHVLEMIQALDAAPLGNEFLGIGIRSDLEVAVENLLDFGATPEDMLDWAMHLEDLAAKLREAAR